MIFYYETQSHHRLAAPSRYIYIIHVVMSSMVFEEDYYYYAFWWTANRRFVRAVANITYTLTIYQLAFHVPTITIILLHDTCYIPARVYTIRFFMAVDPGACIYFYFT